MRISGIEEFLGGADNVAAMEIIRGEQLPFVGTVNDSNGDPIDIASFTISATAQFYRSDVTIQGRGRSVSATVSDFQVLSGKADRTLTVTKDSDSTTGKFTVLIPEDLADTDDTAALDEQNQVLTPVIYITYDNGDTPSKIRKSRILLIVRHGD